MLSRLACIAVAAAAAGVSPATPAFAVANGDPVPDGRYRFAVRLTMTDVPRPDGTHYDSACSGALLSPWWIITAGHCFHDPNRNPVSGPVPYRTTTTFGRVVQVQQAPSGDIALAKLAKPVHDVTPLRLSGRAPKTGDVLRIAGWGKLAATDQAPATRLRTGQVKVASVAPDTLGLRGYRPAANTSACEHDSGAPYFTESARSPELVSVESTGPACPHDREETTTRVGPLRDWIRGRLPT